MERHVVRPEPTSSPTGGPLFSTSDRAIPADLLREASQRLAITALTAGVLWILGWVLWHIAQGYLHPDQDLSWTRPPDAICLAGALLSFATFFYIRRQKDRPPEFVLRIGLGYMLVTCAQLALMMHVDLPITESLGPQISWIGVVLVMFAAVVPVKTRHIAIASLIGASMGPVAMVISRVHGLDPFSALKTGLLMHYADFLLAGLAVVISKVVTRLGQQVSKAREMGSYRLGELIRRGGMGEVYRATHRMLARPAAIKLIRSEMLESHDGETADVAVKRFHREAEAAANLRSPHTVELFDFGITDDKTLYFVMEYLEGLDLETLVREHGALPSNRVIHILRQACESLEEAHAKGLVHRDIKPANLHIGKLGIRYDFVKVLDFGLVKSVHREDSQISLATVVGRTPGTPSYMAPEMALGENVDSRADIYALGCVAYFLLTGKLVFDAETTFQMVAKHMRNQPVPPTLRGNVQIPPQLEDLVLKCLAKAPEDRPRSARALSDSLAAIRIPAWTEEEAAAWWQARQDPLSSASPRGSDGLFSAAPSSRLLEPTSTDSRT